MSRLATTSIATRHLLEVLDAAGVRSDDLLAEAGTTREALAAPDAEVPLDAFARLWARAAAVQPDIGLTLVDRFPAGQMHVLAHLAMRSPDVRRALEDAGRYATVTSAADRLELASTGGLARFSVSTHGQAPANPWFAEHYLSMSAVFLARATGRGFPIRAVRFAAPAQAPAAAYVARFGVAPVFEAGVTALDFDAEALDWPLLTQDVYLHAILEAVAKTRRREAPKAAPDSVAERARQVIARAVAAGATPTLADVAATDGLTARALRDRLAKQGTGFRQLLDDVRRDLAREYLGQGQSVTETAYLLGFSEPAALQHACLRWFDRPAGRMRGAGA